MKLIFLTLFIGLTIFSRATIDTVNIEGNTVLEIKNGKETFQSEPDVWDKYSSGLIALATVAFSLWISYYQAKKSIKATRANSISEARIQWIQQVRPLMSGLMTLVYEVEYEMPKITEFVDLNTNQVKKKVNDYEKGRLLKLAERFEFLQYELAEKLFSLKLMLNPKEDEHLNFINLIESYLHDINKKSKDENYTIKTSSLEIVNAGNRIIKNAWEQAKNEGNKKK